MTKIGGSRGLRERKKEATRLAIRDAAFRLFEAQGYENTTVEEIAEAADVSPRTFYRYFPTKETVLADDRSQLVIDAFVAAPAELSPVAAYRFALRQVIDAMSPLEKENEIRGRHVFNSVPEARGTLYADYTRLIKRITDALELRSAAPTDRAERRVIAGAIVGVLIAVLDNNPLPIEELDRELAILDDRLS